MGKKNGTLLAKKTLINEQPRLLKYIPKQTQKAIALNVGNPETQRDIILAHVEARHPGMASIFNDNYYSEVDDFISYIEDRNPNDVEKGLNKKMGLKGKVRVREDKKKQAPVIKSKTKDGKVYSRTKSINFENKKVTVAFIKKRVEEGKSNKQITSDYNKFAEARGWNTRTQSSIVTLKSREGLKKQK